MKQHLEKRFIQWLNDNNIYEYFKENKELRQCIIEDFLWEEEAPFFKNLESSIDLMLENPNMMESKFPYTIKRIKQRVKESSPLVTAGIIQNVSKSFPKWRSEYPFLNKVLKEKVLAQHEELLFLCLDESAYDEPIIKETIKFVRPQVEEELSYWLEEKRKLKDGNDFNTINLQNNPNPRIFKNHKAFEFFERLIETDLSKTGTGFAFIFRKMKQDNLINEFVRESEFRKWLNDKFEILISSKLKTLDGIGNIDLRLQIYYSLKH